MGVGEFTILWDNDGVLVDTEHLYYAACREALGAVGVELTRESFQRISLRQGRSTLDLSGLEGKPLEDLRADRDRRYRHLLRRESRALPGAPAVLRRLHGRVRMGVVTSAPRLEFGLTHQGQGMREMLEFVLTREDYERSKPHPDPYREALARHAVTPERALVIEDTERGLESARAAGLPCAVVPHDLSRGGGFEEALRVLESIEEVPGLLEEEFGISLG